MSKMRGRKLSLPLPNDPNTGGKRIDASLLGFSAER